MFLWNVEDLRLYTESKSSLRKEPVFECEKTTIREDKIAFVDSFHKGNLSYMTALLDKYATDKEKLPKDKFGCVWTNSLKKWTRENDPRNLIDNKVWHGKYTILGTERFIQLDFPGKGDFYPDLVDECFHRQLLRCLEKEKEWYRTHDERYILEQKLCEEWKVTNIMLYPYARITYSGEVYETSSGEKLPLETVKRLTICYKKLNLIIEEIKKEME